MKRETKQIICLVLMIVILLLPYFVFAGDTMKSVLNNLGEFSGYDTSTNQNTVAHIVASIIKAFLALIGTIFLVLLVLGGFKWMTAGGDEEKVRQAKDTIKVAIIGLIIIIAAYSITYFIFTNLPGGTGSSTGPV